jgi:hypothetical protein
VIVRRDAEDADLLKLTLMGQRPIRVNLTLSPGERAVIVRSDAEDAEPHKLALKGQRPRKRYALTPPAIDVAPLPKTFHHWLASRRSTDLDSIGCGRS